MPDYFLAPSLAALRRETNERWPNRDKTSDGWIGDASHQARPSDHNPDWDAPGARRGVVRAIDIDKDGIDVAELLVAVVRDPRVAYVIWNRRIASATDDGTPWNWEPYDGPNPHTSHVHISIKHTATAESDTSQWYPNPEEDDMTIDELLDADIVVEVAGQRRNFGSLRGCLATLMLRTEDDDARTNRIETAIRDLTAKLP
jgi:hypothetical protein